MDLIRLSNYVTEIRVKNYYAQDFYDKVCKYVDFIFQKPKLEMFIPCDINGKYIENKRPIQAYNKDHQKIDFAIENSDYVLGGDDEYYTSLEKVLFTDWKFYSNANGYIYIINDYDELIYFNSKNECYIHVEDGDDIIVYDIEYLINNNLAISTIKDI